MRELVNKWMLEKNRLSSGKSVHQLRDDFVFMSSSEWRKAKTTKTKKRYQMNEELLKTLGWNTLTEWGCDKKRSIFDLVQKIEFRK